MKKFIALFVAALMLLALMAGCGAAAETETPAPETAETQETTETQTEPVEETEETEEAETEVEPAESVSVYVTIADAGELVVAYEPVEAEDIDGDGIVSISDALYCVHEAFYDGGAEAGYAAEETEYGLSLTKLWGVENGGSYGYYVNNASAWSLADAVAKDDYIYAFGYADLEGWSDVYTYFNVLEGTNSVELTLYYIDYDENWNPVEMQLTDATLTVDGEAFPSPMNEEGSTTMSLQGEPGTYVISAVTDAMTITPPVCILTVE